MQTVTIVTAILISQLASSQTTVEEYTYLRNGYKVQVVEQGGDLKKGYELKYVNQGSTTTGTDVRKVYLSAFYKIIDSSFKMIAGYLIKYQLNNNPVEYICIPNPQAKKEIKELYLQVLYDGNNKVSDAGRLQAILYVIGGALKW